MKRREFLNWVAMLFAVLTYPLDAFAGNKKKEGIATDDDGD